MGRERSSILSAGRFLLSVAILFALAAGSFGAAQAQAAETNAAPLCRFGVNVDRRDGSSIDSFDIEVLRAGFYMDYHAAREPSRPNGMRYMLRIKLTQIGADGYSYRPAGTALADAVAGNPGAVWYIGNEPDRVDVQDDIEPEVYAAVYHELYGLIKGYDPTAQIFPGSIVQATELRLKYLDRVLDAYRAAYGAPLPADGWNIHGFILNEERSKWGAGIPPGLDDDSGLVLDVQETDDFDIFVEQIERFRRWMYQRGYRDVPLYLSEYGVLMPKGLFNPDFTEGRVNAFMDRSFDYLLNETHPIYGYPPDENRLVQHMSWYSTNDKGFNGYLFDVDNDNELSLMGKNYAAYTAAIEDEVDFFPVKVFTTPSAPLYQDGTVTLIIHAEIANSGNLVEPHAAEVRFFNGDPAEGGQQIGDAKLVTLSGCGDTAVVKHLWPDVAPDSYEVFVDVQAIGDVTDSSVDNDTGSQYTFFSNFRLYVPFVE